MNQLWSDIKRNGLQNSLSLSVSRKTGRALLFDGNHRFTLFRNKKVEWVPLKVSYFFIEDDDDESFRFVPKVYDDDESFRFVPKVYDEDEWPTLETSAFKSRNKNLTIHN